MSLRLLPFVSFLALIACTDTGGGKGDASVDTGALDGGTAVDEDGDGFPADEDCDDSDGTINGGATEICDGVDNDCDGEIDEGVTSTFYRDADGDGFGDADTATDSCEIPAGYVPNANDCDDTQGDAFPGNPETCDGIDNDCDGTVDEDVTALYYADSDGDGFGDPAAGEAACTQPSGTVTDNSDCDDTTAAAFPGNLEICDEIDNNCDGSVDEGVTTTYYADLDGDSYGDPGLIQAACALPAGYAARAGDCDDGEPTTNPSASEYCDGHDDDCDGTVDEDDAVDASVFYRDADVDGFGAPASSYRTCYLPSGYVVDNTDCDDTRAATNPAATEYCNTHDDDCDGTVDEDDAADAADFYRDADSDGYGNAAIIDHTCYQPSGYVSDNTDCDDLRAATNPAALEYCNTHDDDCDGTVDEDDAVDAADFYRDSDSDSYGDPSVIDHTCYQPSGYVSDNTDCDDAESTTNPGASEYCDGHDDDCDGTVDEDDAVDASDFYADADADGYGNPSVIDHTCYQPSGYVSDNTDCDDALATTNPGATEYCNGRDDDCDGSTDENSAADALTWYADTDSDSYGDAGNTLVQCTQPSGYLSDDTDCDDTYAGTYPGADEYCDSRDNDCDGTVDEDGEVLDGDTFYADVDADLTGDPNSTMVACTQPSGYIDNFYDCDDSDSGEPVVADRATGSSGGAGTMASPLYDLQDAVDRASQCVIAFAGTYQENIVVDASIDIWGVDGADFTTIDANDIPCDGADPDGCEPALTIATGTGIAPTIHGFTVMGGSGYVSTSTTTTTCADSSASHSGNTSCTVYVYEYCGGGIYVEGDDPVLYDLNVADNTLPEFEQYTIPCGGTACNYEQNWLYSYGGGICLKDSAASLEDVHVYDNFADQGGGAYVGDAAVVDWSHSYIAENEAGDGGGLNVDGATLSATNVLFAFNDADTDGGGLFSQNAGVATLVNSNAAHNTSATGTSRGDAIYGSSGTTLTAMNSIFHTNSAQPVVYSAGTWAGTYNDVYNAGAGSRYAGTAAAGTGSVGTNPQWQSITNDSNIWNDDWSLQSTSPAINTGDPAAIYNDADGSRNDMGITGGPGGTWN